MPVKTAIFIDFDNFHSNLEKVDPRAAERFADDPAGWLEWFRLGRHAGDPGADNGADTLGQTRQQTPGGRAKGPRRAASCCAAATSIPTSSAATAPASSARASPCTTARR